MDISDIFEPIGSEIAGGQSCCDEHNAQKYVRQLEQNLGILFPYESMPLVKFFVDRCLASTIFQAYKQGRTDEAELHGTGANKP